MNKSFEDELMQGMQQELRKQASAEEPDLVHAAECLHAALEIFEGAGLQARADDILNILQKIAQHTTKQKPIQNLPSLQKLMEAGLTQKDLKEFSEGNPTAKAKLNMVLRGMGYGDHEIAKFIGHKNVVSESDARELLDPNRALGKMWKWMQDPTSPTEEGKSPDPGDVIEFTSIAQPGKIHDPHTQGLTPDKEVKNLLHHGTVFNMGPNDADDQLLDVDLAEDSLEVFDKEIPLEDFEDERSK